MNALFLLILGLGFFCGAFFLGKKALKTFVYTKEELISKINEESPNRRVL